MSAKQRKLDTSHSRQEKAIKDSLENQSERLDRTKVKPGGASVPII